MAEECLCLTWNNQGATYQQMLNHLRVENILTDCTLACDGQKFFVHRLVLVTCSDFFKSLLEDVPCQHPIMYLRGINGREMQALIDFMYLGKVDVPQRDMSKLLSTAESLQIKGLGVLNPRVKDEAEQSINKRKRSPFVSPSETLERKSPNEAVSSLSSSEPSTCESNSSKRSLREWTRDKTINNSQLPNSSSVQNGNDHQHPNYTEKMEPFCNKNSRNEASFGAIIKSSPIPSLTSSSVPLSTEFNSPSVTEPSNYTLLTGSSSSNEGHTLAKLTPLQPYVPDQSRSSDYYSGFTESTIDAKMTGTSCYSSETISKEQQAFEDLSKIKEEGIDCTLNSATEKTSCPIATSHYQKEPPPPERDRVNSFPKDGSYHMLENVSRNPSNLQLQHLQDENFENGTEAGRPYLCPICCKSFAKVSILKRHHLAHFRPYNCHLCSRSFTRREVLAEHVLEHNGADLRLPCPVCKMTIKRKRNLQAHIKVKHPEYHKQKSANNEALC